ncbi:hypothetical protein ACSTJA_23955, partial [Vibrio parahaemolyticus]
LLISKADVNIKNDEDKSPLDCAMKLRDGTNKKEILNELLSHPQIECNNTNRHRDNALHNAINSNLDMDIIKKILDKT